MTHRSEDCSVCVQSEIDRLHRAGVTTYTTFRDGVDSWIIRGCTPEGLEFDLAFSTEASRNEAWRFLEGEDLGNEKFLYGMPGLVAP